MAHLRVGGTFEPIPRLCLVQLVPPKYGADVVRLCSAAGNWRAAFASVGRRDAVHTVAAGDAQSMGGDTCGDWPRGAAGTDLYSVPDATAALAGGRTNLRGRRHAGPQSLFVSRGRCVFQPGVFAFDRVQ